MNSKNYKKAMSGVHPSEQMVERIMDMTESKRKPTLKKGMIGVLVALAILACGAVTANGATDGAVAQAIDKGIANFKVMFNGEELELEGYNISYVDENGNKISLYEIDLPDSNGKVIYDVSDEGDSVGISISSEGEIEGELQLQTDDFIESTTAEAE